MLRMIDIVLCLHIAWTSQPISTADFSSDLVTLWSRSYWEFIIWCYLCILNISDTLPLRESHILGESSSPSTFSARESWATQHFQHWKHITMNEGFPSRGSTSLLCCKGHFFNADVWDFSCKQMMSDVRFLHWKPSTKKESSHWKRRAKFFLPSFLSFETDPNVHLQNIHPKSTSSGNRFCLDCWTPSFDGWGGISTSLWMWPKHTGSARQNHGDFQQTSPGLMPETYDLLCLPYHFLFFSP